MTAAGLVWGMIIGFYDSQLPYLIFLLFGGAALLWVAGKLSRVSGGSTATEG